MNEPLAWCNDRFMPLAEAGLPWIDAGFVYGAVIVDNARTFRRQLFLWPQHLERLRRHCRLCNILLPYDDSYLTQIARALLEHNGRLLASHEEMQVVTFVTPGRLGLFQGTSDTGPPTVGMMTYPLPRHRYRRFFTEGVTLEIVGQQHYEPDDLLPPVIKHRSRLVWYIAEQRRRCSAAVPVVVNSDGVGDTAIGTIVAITGSTLLLPPQDWVLESISVQFLRQICPLAGLAVQEAVVDLRLLLGTKPGYPPSASIHSPVMSTDPPHGAEIDELLLVGTAFCLAGVRRLLGPCGERIFPWPGPAYQRLLNAWEEHINVPIVRFFTT
ncbi:MAG: aminotransferase class IV [Gemmataceae bacterium]|nr:aminotransferase class IV [Gemmataceae bacterium]MCS7270822.1 aminotransferase class IV [Gemmataceae bacterium]MDW8243382.1 aminotransferase class IV [Thermogemmata sp.]